MTAYCARIVERGLFHGAAVVTLLTAVGDPLMVAHAARIRSAQCVHHSFNCLMQLAACHAPRVRFDVEHEV